jgi:hypothetical protein
MLDGRQPRFDGAAEPDLRRICRAPGSLGPVARAARRAVAFVALVICLTLATGAAVASAAPEIAIQNLDEVPFADRLAFNRIQAQGANGVHDTAAVRIHNEGADPLIIAGLDISGPWQSIDTVPAAVAGGGSFDVRLKFTATSIGTKGGRYDGSLTVRSNDTDEPARTVQLAGFWQSIPEGSPSQEPTVHEIVGLFGYGTTITGSGQQLNRGGRVEAVGDEVLSPYWQRADASRPVVVRQLAAFHQQGQLDALSTTNVATSANSPTNPPASQPHLSHDEADSQSLLPRTLDTLAPGKAEFTPAQPVFGFRVRDEWSDPRINRTGGNIDAACLQARQADPSVRCGHHMRFWPAKDRAGATLPNTWLMFMDYAGVNYDYQDDAYLISNIRPHAGGAPVVTASRPAHGATGVPRDTSIATDLFLPSGGIDNSTLTPSTTRLVRASDGAQVPATIGTSGGGDTVVLTPTVLLQASTSYRFEITSGLKDVAGNAFVPFTMTFTTGTGLSDPGGSVGAQFEQVALPSATRQYDFYTGLTMGPDGKLYAGMADGRIRRFPVDEDGTLGAPQTIASLQQANGGPRLLIGLRFDPAATSTNLILWTSHSTPGFEGSGRPDWGGKITRLSGPNLATVQDIVVNLPRSARDHVTNGIDFGPDGALYFMQGSNSAMGAPDSAWANRPERLLTAAVLRLDPTRVTSPPLNAKTADGGTYDPFAPGAPLTIYASGIRNAFDLVWHSNGRLYVPANGSAAGGNTPATPSSLPPSCQKRLDGAYTGPSVAAITGVNETQHDWLFRIDRGGYYGHPNPTRCEWVLNGGNPTSSTDPGQVSQYPVQTLPDRNWRGAAYDFGLNKSPNGVVEYTSGTFGGALKGQLLVVRYSANDDIIALTPGGTNQDIVAGRAGIPGMTQLKDPLDLVEDPRTGNLYVSEFDERGAGQRITLLRALDVAAPEDCAPDSTRTCSPVGVQPPFNSTTTPLPTAPRGSEGLQPRSPVRINAGGPSLQVGPVRWSECPSVRACSGWVRGGTSRKVGKSTRIARPVAPAGAALYRSHWRGRARVRKGAVAFTYDIPVGKGSFTVRLHFADPRRNEIGDRVFDVGIEGGAPELVAFDPVAQAGRNHRAVVREFPVRTEDGRVTIRFRRRTGMPLVSGIEVLPRAAGADAPATGSLKLAARSSTRAGRPVTLLSGRLVASRSLHPGALAGKQLLVERRRRGGGYQPVRMIVTRSAGRFEVPLEAPPVTMLYRLRFAGDGDVGPGVSRRVSGGPG